MEIPTTLAPVVDLAASQLVTLTVADPDPARTPYERDDYDGAGWADFDGDCISTRHELLITYSFDPPVIDGCQVTAGRWVDPYDGTTYTDAADVQIDHLIPLAEAHRAGAWRWDLDTRSRFTNDETPGHLLVVGDASNQAKADSTPDRWLPPDPAAHCQYAIDWIGAKARWQLTITGDELVALNAALGRCTPTSPLRPAVTGEQPIVVITTPTTTTTTTIAPTAGPGAVGLIACDKRNEAVTIGNTGSTPVSLDGYTLHDDERNHETGLGGFGSLQPGQQLIILTGPAAAAGPGAVVWKNQNVWNNDGDTAYLIAPDGTTTTRAC